MIMKNKIRIMLKIFVGKIVSVPNRKNEEVIKNKIKCNSNMGNATNNNNIRV
jgi:hypothetical protein